MYIDAYRMSVLNAVIQTKDYLITAPEISLQEAIPALKRLYAWESFDYRAAVTLEDEYGLVTRLPSLDREERLVWLLSELMYSNPPWWARSVVKGRRFVKASADVDSVQCLRLAGLFEDAPSNEVRAWWDRMANHFRAAHDRELTELGRSGEELTLAHERQRLEALGRPDLRPRWVSIDDNSLGYDVLSYDIDGLNEDTVFIESKATSLIPLSFHVTRNEWRVAASNADKYRFHVWHIPTEALTELVPADIEPHIPVDNGNGRWQEVLVRFRA